MPAGGPPGLPAGTSLQTALADLLTSQHRLELAFQSASASQMQGSDTDTAATVAAADITQAAIQVGPSGISAWLYHCTAHQSSMLYAELSGRCHVDHARPAYVWSSTVALKLPSSVNTAPHNEASTALNICI